MQDPNLPPGVTDADTDNDTACRKCGMEGLNEDGEQEHWSTCPTLKDPDDYPEID